MFFAPTPVLSFACPHVPLDIGHDHPRERKQPETLVHLPPRVRRPHRRHRRGLCCDDRTLFSISVDRYAAQFFFSRFALRHLFKFRTHRNLGGIV